MEGRGGWFLNFGPWKGKWDAAGGVSVAHIYHIVQSVAGRPFLGRPILVSPSLPFPYDKQPPPSANLFGGEVVWVVERAIVWWCGEGEADFHALCNPCDRIRLSWEWFAPKPSKCFKRMSGSQNLCGEFEL